MTLSTANSMETETEMKSVLFLCTGNSCRSQMAEGFARALHSQRLVPFSAGVEQHGLNLHAVEVMQELGIDLLQQKSKTIDQLPDLNFDLVVTVCDHASEVCPIFPGAGKVVHHSFADPPALAKGLTDRQAVLDCYRSVRDQIRSYVEELPDELGD